MADDREPVMSATMGPPLSPSTPQTASTLASTTIVSQRSGSQDPAPPSQPPAKDYYTAHGRNSISTYPEVAPKQEAHGYAYSVPDPTPLYRADTNAPIPYVAKKKRRWNWWPYLLAYGLLIALIAALIGGFVGKAIEHNGSRKEITKLNDSLNSLSDSTCPTGTTPPSRTSSSPSASSTISSTATSTPTTATASIPRPSTGCQPIDKQASFRSFSTSLSLSFDTLCWTGWTGDDLYPLYATTPSDCIESCAAYNRFKPDGARECIGGGFIPDWANKTVAMEELGTPFNCFLKHGTSSIGRNDREVTEVVSLCLPGLCKDAFTTP